MKIIYSLLFLSISPVLASPVNHQHAGRPHSHALPSEGLKHRHNQGAIGSAVTSQPNKSNVVTPVANQPHGYFSGAAKLEQLPDGRRKKLLEKLVFTDLKGKQWVSPKGSIVDGASIPPMVWPIIGAPFSDKYLAASIIHDVACDEKKDTWQSVHKVFYEAMLASGVEKSKARRMYAAVYNFGPRWGKEAERPLSKEEFKAVISDPHEKGIKHLISFGTLKKFSGSSIYAATKKNNAVVGIVKKYNDVSLKVELGKRDSGVRLDYKSNENPASFYVEKGIKNTGNYTGAGLSYTPKVETASGFDAIQKVAEEASNSK